MEKKNRIKLDAEFKDKSGLRGSTERTNVEEVSKKYGIHHNLVKGYRD